MPSGEERKLVTVVFADIVGSTALADDEDPERVRARLQRFYEAMADEIERTGGTVEKFAGDAIMAVFGAPAALEDHAERALHAALAMQHRLQELFEGKLELRVGVNTGEAVVGEPREGSTFVAGDVVNISARLEQAAEPGEVLCGDRTVTAARGAFEFGERRVVKAKGKPDGIVCYTVVRALSLMRPRGVGGLRRVFVGRESELELLRALFRRTVDQSEAHLVTLVGAPGVGKTRLIRELWEVLAEEETPPRRRTGRCLAYGDGITYWPLGEILKEEYGILDSDSPEEVHRRLGDRHILGLALGLDVARDLHPLDARERLHEAVVELIQELGTERPLVLLVEDVHAAEDDLLDLLERVVRDSQSPALVLATTRPELLDRRPTWGAGRRNATTILLEPLSTRDTSLLLEELLGQSLPPELDELLVARAEGNPFFMEELVGELVDAGVLERDDGAWRARELPAGFSAPDSVTAVLAARIDRLPPREKDALQAASVVGRIFWSASVVYLLGGGEEPDFSLLEERDFIRRRGGSGIAGEREYAIKHQLTREVAYGSISKARRGALHAAFAEWLESSDRARDEYAPLLAYHYAESVRPEDVDLTWGGRPDEAARLRSHAVTWLRRAATLARARYEMEDAVALFTQAVGLCDDDHERALLWREIGLAQALRFDGEAFWSAMREALAGPLTVDERADVYGVLAFQTAIRSGMWVVETVPELVREWAEAALELGGAEGVSGVRALLALGHNDPVAHAADARDAGSLAEKLDDVELRSYALGVSGFAAAAEFRFAEADALAQRRLELVPEIHDPDHLVDLYEETAAAVAAVGRFEEARRLVSLHESVAALLSPHHRLHSLALRCEIEDAAGDWASITSRADAIAEGVERNLATPCIRNARSLLLSAVAHTAIGAETAARELEQWANGLLGGGDSPALVSARQRLALLREDRAELERLLEFEPFRMWVFGAGVVAARLDGLVAVGDRDRIEREAPPLATPGHLLEPFALRALGAARRDDDLLAEADERFTVLGLHWHRAQTERLLAGL